MELTQEQMEYLSEHPEADDLVPMIRMSDVELKDVSFLWRPYIPFGKLTILHGDPGQGKTYLAMQLCAACTNRVLLPNMEEQKPFNVIFQTAEDGLGDTIKPRLIEAGADLDRVLVIREEPGNMLTLSDDRIEKAIIQNKAKMFIVDPVQAFIGDRIDMNRANEVRPIFRHLADVAERTDCAIIPIGHLNKKEGSQSTYRGLGSIDITASARSVLLVGCTKNDPDLRVVVHDKSSLAPAGSSLGFILGDDEGFRWIGEYDITANELLTGTKGQKKTDQAIELIRQILSGGREMLNEDLDKAALSRNISTRTLREAKKELGDELKSRITEGRKKVFWME